MDRLRPEILHPTRKMEKIGTYNIIERRILFLDTHNSMDVVQLLPFVFSYASQLVRSGGFHINGNVVASQSPCPRQKSSSSWGNSTFLESRPVLSAGQADRFFKIR